MTTKNPISESRKAVATKVAENYFGVSTETINNIVNKFVRIAVRDENKPYCTTIVETYVAGAERYRITIEGAYNDLQNGGTKKTDFCFANIRFEIKGINGLYAPYGDERVRVNGVSADEFAKMIFDTIMVYYLEMAENWRHGIVDANRAIEDAYDEVVVAPMQELVAEAQETFDNYVMDLQSIADNYGALETALDYYAAKQIAERIKDLGESLLSDLGAISGCEMCEEDGYWFTTAEFERWAGGYTFDHIDEIENLIDTLDYYITDAPLGFDKDTLDFELGGYEDETSFLGLVTDYPCYLWDELRDFISTRYHYAYCA